MHVINGDTSLDSDCYFRYDAMNCQTTVDAVDAAGNIGTRVVQSAGSQSVA